MSDRLLELYRRLVRAIVAAPGRAALIVALALMPAMYLTARYFTEVHAGLQDLLADDAPAVRAIRTLQSRLGGGTAGLNVLVRSPSPEANRRFVRELGASLRARHLPEVRSVQDGVDAERAWARSHAALLIPRERFDTVMTEAREALDQAEREANPLFVSMDDETETVASRMERLRARAQQESAGVDRFPDGYIASRDGRTVLMRVTMAGSDTDVGPAERLVAAVNDEVARMRPNHPSNIDVRLNGDVANLLEEHAAILADMSISSLLVMLLVGALIAAYYRSLRAVGVALLGVLPGVIVTFALGRLAGNTLNSNSAFLGSIILGNGINYPLLLLAWYRAQPASMDRADAIVRAAQQSLPGVAAAAATASAAYLGLAFTSFRGFSQFGRLGGVGMITVAAVTYLATPVAIAVLNPPRRDAESTRVQDLVRRWFAHPTRARAVAIGVLVALAAVCTVGARRAVREGLWDTDLRNLRNTESLRHGAASWDRTVSDIFGTWLTPVVALAPDRAARDRAEAALRSTLMVGPLPMAERIETLSRYVPDDDDQRARIAQLDALRARIDALPRDKVPPDAREFLDAWVPAGGVPPVVVGEVPESLRGNFTERDGHNDRTVLVFPSLAIGYDDARNVVAFADRVAAARVPEGTVVGGAFLFMAEILRVLRAESPRVIAMVCALVALVLLPIFRARKRRVPLVVALVTAVALASQLVMYALGVRLNMLNFAALPITIGVGSDYIVNLVGAMDVLRVDAREACARMGGAILLCSLTTIVGYLTLLLASSGALRSFGQAAVLGEFAAVLLVLAIYPALSRAKAAT